MNSRLMQKGAMQGSNTPQLFEKPIWMTKADLAGHLQLSQSMISKLMTEGLPRRKIGRSVRFRLDLVEEWLSRRSYS